MGSNENRVQLYSVTAKLFTCSCGNYPPENTRLLTQNVYLPLQLNLQPEILMGPKILSRDDTNIKVSQSFCSLYAFVQMIL